MGWFDTTVGVAKDNPVTNFYGGLANSVFGQNTSRADPYNDASGSAVSQQHAQDQASEMGDIGLAGTRAGMASAQGVLSGLTPSLAYGQMQQALGQNNQNAMAMAGSARGVDPSAAFRQAMMSQQQNAMGTSQAAGQLRAQEIAAARGQLLGSGLGQQQLFQNQQDAYGNRAEHAWATAQGVNQATQQANAANAQKEWNVMGGSMMGGGGKKPGG